MRSCWLQPVLSAKQYRSHICVYAKLCKTPDSIWFHCFSDDCCSEESGGGRAWIRAICLISVQNEQVKRGVVPWHQASQRAGWIFQRRQSWGSSGCTAYRGWQERRGRARGDLHRDQSRGVSQVLFSERRGDAGTWVSCLTGHRGLCVLRFKSLNTCKSSENGDLDARESSSVWDFKRRVCSPVVCI